MENEVEMDKVGCVGFGLPCPSPYILVEVVSGSVELVKLFIT
jgi:hypothetical protein